MKSQLVNVQGKGPIAKAKAGKFQVSIWHWKKIIPPPDEMKDLFAEREFDIYRACIRFSQWNRVTRSWNEQSIWCSIDDLRSLVQTIDELNAQE